MGSRRKNKSILADDSLDRCFVCGRYGRMEEHHLFGGSCRRKSDSLGLVVHLCRYCHAEVHDSKDHSLMGYLHHRGQTVYEEKIGTREEFIKDFIRSYL